MGRPTSPSVLTVSGVLVDLYNPTLIQIRWDDVGHALGALARFNGHTRCFYSVAEHSVRVSRRVPPEDALWGLIHDAAEAYIGDIVSPVKALCPELHVIERGLLDVMCRMLGLPLEMPASVVESDARMLATEARDLLIGDTSWCKAQPYFDEIVRPGWTLDPVEAGEAWMQRFEELTGGAHG